MALRLVAASQRNDLDQELSAATGLLSAHQVHVLLMAIRVLAQALKVRRFVLAPINNRQAAIATLRHTPHGHTLQ
jgi:Na+-translocating ferredoxin:NAD+ oxidoreductase RnfC subunit